MRVSTHPTPNVRLADLSLTPEPCPLDLWELERQAAGIEPGELALSRPYAVMQPRADVWFRLMVAGLFVLLMLDVWHAITFLMGQPS